MTKSIEKYLYNDIFSMLFYLKCGTLSTVIYKRNTPIKECIHCVYNKNKLNQQNVDN